MVCGGNRASPKEQGNGHNSTCSTYSKKLGQKGRGVLSHRVQREGEGMYS